MLKEFKTANGVSTTIEITDGGKVIYSVGKKKTTFNLSDCESITYEYSKEKVVITEEMLSGTDEFESWIWLVINEGENRLEYNNNQTESRRHYSYSEQNDKRETIIADEDVLEKILHNLEKDELKEAIKKLEPKQQELIYDIYYRGISKSDIARRDGVSKMAITNRVNKVIKRLKNNFKNF